ncbi:hypothetical protein [Campylobacter volucris]|uniref:hypothetical protein n=1 Tax=Campylobacter volucris TaxID=1031542 RepID=UPI001059D637|nr:hypothetical protein [Campylobacter volucris]TDJ82037.1 hypothetical protein E2O25_01855 [Campylobacter volucris]
MFLNFFAQRRIEKYKYNDRFDLWRNFFNNKRIYIMAEIGVWKGDFSAFMLKNFNNIKTYYMIDPWGGI